MASWWFWRNMGQVFVGIILVVGLCWFVTYSSDRQAESQVKPGWKMVRAPGNLQTVVLYEDAVWAGGVNGLFRYDREAKKMELPSQAPPFTVVYELLTDRQGRLWIAHEKGIAWFDGQAWGELGENDGVAVGPVYAVMQDQAGMLWLGRREGVLRYHPNEKIFYGPREGIAIGPVDTLYQDRQGQIWIGSSDVKRGGLGVYDGHRWRMYHQADGLVHMSVNCITETNAGVLWVGTGFATSGGANYLRADGIFNRLTREGGLAGDKVRQIYEDSQGLIWFTSEYDGVALFKDGKPYRNLTMAEGLAGQEVKRIAQEKSGVYWLATDQGLNKIETIP